MLHGALFFAATPSDNGTMSAEVTEDGSVRKFRGAESAYLVGVTVSGLGVGYVKILNDLWKNSQYLEIPSWGFG